MKGLRIASGMAALAAASAFAAQPGDIVVTPPAGAGVSITNAAGDTTRFRVADDGSVTIPGVISKGPASPFLHSTGSGNLFVGEIAGNLATSGINNAGVGFGALNGLTSGAGNTAVGAGALILNTTGQNNTASGYSALLTSASSSMNTAIGAFALRNAATDENTAVGFGALRNSTGLIGTALGSQALLANTTGNLNTALGGWALIKNTAGDDNTAIGYNALKENLTGSNNIAIGSNAGPQVKTGSFNILIGNLGTVGNVDESATIRIGSPSVQLRAFIAGVRGVTTANANAIPVMIDGSGQLGTVSSSARFKDDIADMGEASDALMRLRPVTFHYKADQDPAGRTLQYGLIAEEVQQVYPGLVAYSPDGQVETVMYQFLPAMLLNEVQKQRRTIERLEKALAAMERRLGLDREDAR